MATAATYMIADWGRASPAILPAASAGCRAVLIIAAHDDPPPDCAAKVIGRRTWHDHGALALRRDGDGFAIDFARPKNSDRPWAPAPRQEPGVADTNATATTDATALQDDIEPDQ